MLHRLRFGLAALAALAAASSALAAPTAAPAPAAAVPAVPAPAACPNPDALGVSRVMAIDTTGGFEVGRMQYRHTLPLKDMEVVLTFDDGPSPETSHQVLAALAAECAKATFFIVGSMAKAHPSTLRDEDAAGHTIGTHTYSHRLDLQKQPFEVGAEEIDRGIAAVTQVLGHPPAPFFRFPGLGQTKALKAKLAAANIGTFSGDAVGDDWIVFVGDTVRERVLERLQQHRGGIILLHDIKHATAQMLPQLLRDLKERGFKLVQIVPATPAMIASGEAVNVGAEIAAADAARAAAKATADAAKASTDAAKAAARAKVAVAKPAAKAGPKPADAGAAVATAPGVRDPAARPVRKPLPLTPAVKGKAEAPGKAAARLDMARTDAVKTDAVKTDAALAGKPVAAKPRVTAKVIAKAEGKGETGTVSVSATKSDSAKLKASPAVATTAVSGPTPPADMLAPPNGSNPPPSRFNVLQYLFGDKEKKL
jgi:peptidoglycan/xylan/chitin deacetylase (PgdA/CDA1 family)